MRSATSFQCSRCGWERQPVQLTPFAPFVPFCGYFIPVFSLMRGHPELIEEEGVNVGLFRDSFGERGAHAVAGGGTDPRKDGVLGGRGGLQSRGHLP